MKKIVSLVLAGAIILTMLASMVMTAFATDEKLLISTNANNDDKQAAQKAADEYDWEKFKGQNITLNIFNWGEYMSLGQDDSLNVNKAFEEKTGIKINYQLFANNEEMYTKIKSGGGEYDVVIPSDYMIGRMIGEEMIAPLDYSLIPNFELNIDDKFKNMGFDPENKYYVPYTWGTVGIIYNTTMVDKPVTSWDIFWDEDYANNILMFNNSRDAFAIALLKNGKSLNPQTVEDIEIAKQSLIEQKAVVQAYVNDEIFDKMEGGEAAIAPYYAGDAITMISENPDLAFVVPEEGTNYFVDGAVVMANSPNKEAAHMYINFLCEAEVAAANAEFIGYSTPSSQARELLSDEMKNNEIAYPSEEVLNKTESFTVLPEEINLAMDKAWSEVKSFNQSSNMLIVPILLIVGVVVIIALNVVKNKKKNKIDY